MSHQKVHGKVTDRIELFKPSTSKFDEVSLLDCNDSFTHNLVQAFLKLHAPVRVFRSHDVTVDEVMDQLGSYLVLSPGPGIPDEGGIAKKLYEKLMGKIPVLGVCLGMQVINEVLGGETTASPVPVHGKVSVINHTKTGIFTDIDTPTPVARYHSLMVKPSPDLEIQSMHQEVIMAFRIKKYRTTAVQFHPESFLTIDGMKMLQNFLEGHL